MASDPSFAIPARPERRYPRTGGVEYEGTTVFHLDPDGDPDESLESLVETVLAGGPYRSGDFFELPMAVWLVRDEETGDVFRVSVRDGRVGLHVLPATESAGLRRFYERLRDRSDCDWSVDCRTTVE